MYDPLQTTQGIMMAMTKKERAEFDAALLRAETLAALRWTGPVERDIYIPKMGYSEGWDYNAYSKTVWLGWSTFVSHGTGPAKEHGRIGGSQNGRRLFSTEAKALAALRHELEQQAAADMLKIDRRIASLAAAQPPKE